MSTYQESIPINLGPNQTGLTLAAQLLDAANNPYGSVISTGFTEIGSGIYSLSISLPSDFTGSIYFWSVTNPSKILAIAGIEPLAQTSSGVNVCTITVTDTNSNPLQNALVSLVQNSTPYVSMTDSSGIAQINVPNGTFSMSASLAGYQSPAPVSISVSGSTTATITLSTVSGIIVPSPSVCACYGVAYLPTGGTQAGMQVTFTLTSNPPSIADGSILDASPVIATTNSSGQLSTSAGNWVSLYQGGTYSISIGNSIVLQNYVVPAAASTTLPALVGTP